MLLAIVSGFPTTSKKLSIPIEQVYDRAREKVFLLKLACFIFLPYYRIALILYGFLYTLRKMQLFINMSTSVLKLHLLQSFICKFGLSITYSCK